MVIDRIRKLSVKGVKLKSESFFSISPGVLELWRKTLGGRNPPPPPPPSIDRVKEDREFSLLHQEFPQILPHLVPVVKVLKKNWGHWENLAESGGQTFKGSDR